MMTAQTPHSAVLDRGSHQFKWPKLAIGPRLIVSFLAIILLTGLIGLVAVLQLGTLTIATTNLTTRDLPEVATLGLLRTLLFRQRELEQRLVSADDPAVTNDLADLTITLDQIADQRAILLTFEPPTAARTAAVDPAQVQQFTDGLLRNNELAKQLQAFVRSDQQKEALALEQGQQALVRQSLLDATAQLKSLKAGEAATGAALVQQQSRQAAWLILGLTLFSVPLSILLALLITHSLTQPLSVLLHATEAMTTGNLEVDPQIAQGDELGQLATAFNSMRLNLSATIATLALERQQTQAIIDASADGIMLVDNTRTILQFNPAAERMSGWQKSEALGLHCWDIFGCLGATPEEAEGHEQLCPLTLAFQTNFEQQSTEMHMSLRTGQQPWFAVSCAPVPQDDKHAEPQQLVVGLHDISQLKALEKLKSDFVAMVSHELRAPLTTVIGSVEMLGLLDPGADPEAFREVVGILEQQTHRLRQVVEEVLQLTRVDAGRLQVHLQPLPIIQFLRSALETMRLAWIGDDHTFSLQAPPTDQLVWADCTSLEIVVRNLLDNACKYSPAGSPIEIEVATAAMENRVLVCVSDHGPGIPPEQLQHIFEPFSRGTHSSRNWTRGYGLGLYIARELLRAHNGEIWAENLKAGGARFVFTLCTVTAEPRDGAPAEEAMIFS